jgi:hypothetical protein
MNLPRQRGIMPKKISLFNRAYPTISRLADALTWKELVDSAGSLEDLTAVLQEKAGVCNLPEYFVELAPMELHAFKLNNNEIPLDRQSDPGAFREQLEKPCRFPVWQRP